MSISAGQRSVRRICGAEGVDPLSWRRVRDLRFELAFLEIIERRRTGTGRGFSIWVGSTAAPGRSSRGCSSPGFSLRVGSGNGTAAARGRGRSRTCISTRRTPSATARSCSICSPRGGRSTFRCI
nr:hypothetical protein [Halalkaliarchaeum desulfuricum]